jgi:hypothetical protein
MEVLVNGERVAEHKGPCDFSQPSRLQLPTNGSAVDVKAFSVVPLKK